MDRWDDAAPPRPTRDPWALAADLDEFGCCLIAEALAGDALAAARERLAGQAAAARALAGDRALGARQPETG